MAESLLKAGSGDYPEPATARLDLGDAIRASLASRLDLYTQVNGIRIRYWDCGQGTPILLLHGIGATAETWLLNVDALAANHRVLVPDLPGSGFSGKTGFEYSVATLADFVSGFLDLLEVDQACVVGHSMGGLAALQAALDHSDQVSRLVLVDSAGLGREIGRWFRLASLPIFRRLATEATAMVPTAMVSDEILASVISNADQIPRDLARELAKVVLDPEALDVALGAVRTGVGAFGQRTTILLRKRLHELSMPTLIVWGSDDPVFPTSHALSAHRLIGESTLRVFTGCLHCPPFERHLLFNELMLRYLSLPDDAVRPMI